MALRDAVKATTVYECNNCSIVCFCYPNVSVGQVSGDERARGIHIYTCTREATPYTAAALLVTEHNTHGVSLLLLQPACTKID